MQKLKNMFGILLFALLLTYPHIAYSWGRWGHFIIGSSAAKILGDHGYPQMKDRAFDLGYYNNVPDVVWKAPETYQVEKNQHYINFEIFNREMGKNKEWLADREEFFKKYPTVPAEAGRNLWRVREFSEKLHDLNSQMQEKSKEKDHDKKDYQELQLKWLSLAGTMGHYVADMAQPLHCSENHDGQFSGQRGIHAYFEEVVVDEIYPELILAVTKEAERKWQKFSEQNTNFSVFELARKLCEDSFAEVPRLLAMDKKLGRKDAKKAAAGYKKFLVSRMALGSLYLAEIWRRELGWRYDGNKFYLFDAKPAYIFPAKEK